MRENASVWLIGALLLASLTLSVAESEGDEAESLIEAPASLVEQAASLPRDEFTICLRDKPMMCLAPGGDLNADGTKLILADRLRTPGQKFRLHNGVLGFADGKDRVISAEHGAQNQIDDAAGGRVWIWKQQELNYDQQWNANEDLTLHTSQVCMRAFPKACLYTNYPTENKVILANHEHAATFWVIRPVKPCAINPCDKNGKCSEEVDGNAKCTCNTGYNLGSDNKCYELDLCQRGPNPCDDQADCTKTGPGKVACTCKKGYQGSGQKGKCEAINACNSKPPPCDKHSDCVPNGPAQYKCVCKAGFVPTSFRTCEEHDLCSNPKTNPCDAHATCKKTGPGKVACSCNPGYGGNGYQCKVVDGCEGTPCGEHGICTRQPQGGRTCSCEPGFEQDKKSKNPKCNEVDMCGRKPCKGKNTYCKKTGPGKHSCLCNAGFMPFWSGDCFKPGSKEALEAATNEGSEAARRELEAQKAKAHEAERRRKDLERQWRQKQKEREESIRALERRIRDLIRDRTTARVQERDTHVAALSERIKQLEAQQIEAAKLAAAQLQFIKQLESAETHKVDRLAHAMAEAGQRVHSEVRRYAERLRQLTREQLEAANDPTPPKVAPPPPAPKPAKAPAKKPVAPPQYGNQINALKPLAIGAATKKKKVVHLAAPKPVVPAKKPRKTRRGGKRRRGSRAARRAALARKLGQSAGGAAAAKQVAASPVADVAARFQQVDLEALATVDEVDANEDAASLETDLAALHAEVDSHLDDVLAHEDDVESEAANIEAEVDQEDQ